MNTPPKPNGKENQPTVAPKDTTATVDAWNEEALTSGEGYHENYPEKGDQSSLSQAIDDFRALKWDTYISMVLVNVWALMILALAYTLCIGLNISVAGGHIIGLDKADFSVEGATAVILAIIIGIFIALAMIIPMIYPFLLALRTKSKRSMGVWITKLLLLFAMGWVPILLIAFAVAAAIYSVMLIPVLYSVALSFPIGLSLGIIALCAISIFSLIYIRKELKKDASYRKGGLWTMKKLVYYAMCVITAIFIIIAIVDIYMLFNHFNNYKEVFAGTKLPWEPSR